ncbi:MAG: hypothetical protein LBH68_01475 [Bifidobacteriaceae bacterium]|jgi:hypothetical protein|nr:hypothetical protein [Bifidobacteriaceae bacterium]
MSLAGLGGLALAAGGMVLSAAPAKAANIGPFACPLSVCTVNAYGATLTGTWDIGADTLVVSGSTHLIIADGGTLTMSGGAINVQPAGNIIMEGGQITGSGEIINRGTISIVAPESTDPLDPFPHTSAAIMVPVANYSQIVAYYGCELVFGARVTNYDPDSEIAIQGEVSLVFTGDPNGGSGSGLVNNGALSNGGGHVYFLWSEYIQEASGKWEDDSGAASGPLYSLLSASAVSVDGADPVAFPDCDVTFTPTSQTRADIAPWAQPLEEDGSDFAYLHQGFAFELAAPPTCTYQGKEARFIGWASASGSLDSLLQATFGPGDLIEASQVSAVMPGLPTAYAAIYQVGNPAPLGPAPKPSPTPGNGTLALTGVDRGALLATAGLAVLLIGAGVGLVTVTRRRSAQH